MLTGLLFLGGAAAGVGIATYGPLRERRQALLRLEQRLAARADRSADQMPARPRLRIALPGWVAPLLLRAQLDPTPQQLALLAGAFPLLFALVLGLAGVAPALLATLALAAVVILYVRARARRGTEALIDTLPVYLDGVRQLMVVGNSLSQALIRALPAAADPVKSYLGGAIRRIELGAPIGDSLQQLADRIAVPEIAMLSAAVRANLRFGGPIATILGNLAQILRERLRIKRELASATAEARVSTKMLIAFPLLLSLFLLTTNPGYRHFFFADPRGHRLAAIAGALQLIGMMVMLRLQRLAF